MCDIADDSCDVWREREIVARKAHTCMGCDEPIQPGHTYHQVVMMYDGMWDRWAHCLRCWAMFDAIADKLRKETGCIPAIDPQLDCGERWENPPDAVAELAFLLPGERPPQLGAAS